MMRTNRSIQWTKLIIALLVPMGGGFLIRLLTPDANEVYAQLIKPPASPPGIVFGIVWPILYFLIGLASYLVWVKKDHGPALYYYYIQLLVNFFWSIIFFNLNLYGLAVIWSAAILILASLAASEFYKVSHAAFFLFLPYLIWLVYALYLTIGVWKLN